MVYILSEGRGCLEEGCLGLPGVFPDIFWIANKLGNEGKDGKNLNSQTWPGSPRRPSPRHPQPPDTTFNHNEGIPLQKCRNRNERCIAIQKTFRYLWRFYSFFFVFFSWLFRCFFMALVCLAKQCWWFFRGFFRGPKAPPGNLQRSFLWLCNLRQSYLFTVNSPGKIL